MPQTHSAPFTGCKIDGFHSYHNFKAADFQVHPRAQDKGMETGQVKNATKLVVVIEGWTIFLNKNAPHIVKI